MLSPKRTGLPTQTSVFERRSLDDIYAEIRSVYREYPQPWVVGFSGGKDSTAALQLIWYAIASLPEEERTKPVFVIASDTRVETPVVAAHLGGALDRINAAALEAKLPFRAEKVSPTLNDSFWVNLIGRGYPAPTTRFRWCTERMKISPANRFIEQRVAEYGEVIMILGVRSSESTTRMQLMSTYQVAGHRLRRHASLAGAYVYAPVAEFSTDDVWKYLLSVPSPWGANNRDLAAMYRNASQEGECPLVIDTSTPSCGNSRFGCWVCTVAQRDSSMEALIDNGEEWMQPLLEFRDWLATTIDPARKHEFRSAKGRDGRVITLKDGTPAARTYRLETSKLMLQRLLEAQQEVQASGPNEDEMLISGEELLEIRRIWRTEREDWEDSVPRIHKAVFGVETEWPADDDGGFDATQQELLTTVCGEFGIPFNLVARMLEAERRSAGMARRSNIFQNLDAILNEDWRSEDEIFGRTTSAEAQLPLLS